MLKNLYELNNSLKGLKKWGETTRVKKVGRNDYSLGAKRLGCRGETSRHQIWGETTRGETTRGELVLGRNDLLPLNHYKNTAYLPFNKHENAQMVNNNLGEINKQK